jgi:hypothetical protein
MRARDNQEVPLGHKPEGIVGRHVDHPRGYSKACSREECELGQDRGVPGFRAEEDGKRAWILEHLSLKQWVRRASLLWRKKWVQLNGGGGGSELARLGRYASCGRADPMVDKATSLPTDILSLLAIVSGAIVVLAALGSLGMTLFSVVAAVL